MWFSSLFGSLTGDTREMGSRDAFEMHWRHVVSHYFRRPAASPTTTTTTNCSPSSQETKENHDENHDDEDNDAFAIECVCLEDATVDDTNIGYHLDQMGKYLLRESCPPILDYILETRLLQNLATLASLNTPRGLVLPAMRLATLIVQSSPDATRAIAQTAAVRRPILDLISIAMTEIQSLQDKSTEFNDNWEEIYPLAKGVVDLIIILAHHLADTDPLLMDLFLENQTVSATFKKTSYEVDLVDGMQSFLHSKSSSAATLNDHSPVFSKSSSKEKLNTFAKAKEVKSTSAIASNTYGFTLFEACMDLLFQPEPISTLAQKGILDIFAVYEKIATTRIILNESVDTSDSKVKDIVERLESYILQDSCFFEVTFQELVLRYIFMMESAAKNEPSKIITQNANDFLDLWEYMDTLTTRAHRSFPTLFTQIRKLLLNHFLHVSLFQSLLVKPDNPRGEEERRAALLCVADLMNCSGKDGLLGPLMHWLLEAKVEALLVDSAAPVSQVIPQTVFQLYTDSIILDKALAGSFLAIVEHLVEIADPQSLHILLGTTDKLAMKGSANSTNKLSSVETVDSLLKIAYIGRKQVPSPADIQKDLDPYFFDALEQKDKQAPVSACDEQLLKDRDNTPAFGILKKMLSKLVNHMHLLDQTEAVVRISGLFHRTAWKCGKMLVFQALMECLLELASKLEGLHKDKGLDVALREYAEGRNDQRAEEVVGQSDIPVADLQQALVVSEISRELLAVFLVRGGSEHT